MASFYNYVFLFVGLSLILSMAGISTSMGSLLGAFADVDTSSPTGNFTVSVAKFQWNDVSGNPWLIAVYALIIAFVASFGYRIWVGGTFGIAETIKVTVVAGILGFMVGDVVGLITYINSIPEGSGMGTVVKLVGFILYLPLAIGLIIAAVDWIGGGR